MELYLNERKTAQEIIETGKYTDKIQNVLMLLARYYYHGFDNYDYHTWRKERYYNEEIDNYIKAFIPLIDGVFQTFSKKLKAKQEKKYEELEIWPVNVYYS